MSIFDLIYLALRNFKSRRMRTFLTILGMGVGFGTVFFLVSLGYGLQQALLERITNSESLLTLDAVTPDPDLVPLDTKRIRSIEAIANVEEIAYSADLHGQITQGETSADVTVQAVHEAFMRLNNVEVIAGRIPEKEKTNEAVISSATLLLFGIQDPALILNTQLTLTVFVPGQKSVPAENAADQESIQPVPEIAITPEQSYTIVGVVEDDILPTVMVRRESLGVTPSSYSVVKVKVADSEHLEAVRNRLIELGFSVVALLDTVEQANAIFRIIQIILAVFGMAALVVSAIGMINTMTVALLERMQEIGIMKAIGASDRTIAFLFLTESAIIGMLGGITGVIIGYSAGALFNFGLNLLAQFLGGQSVHIFARPVWFIILIIAFSGIVGFIAGIFPARRAGKLRPLAALRYR